MKLSLLLALALRGATAKIAAPASLSAPAVARPAARGAAAEPKGATTALVRGGGGGGLGKRLEIGGLFAAWYALNVYYNVLNKRVLKACGLPWLAATAQLGVGACYTGAAWASGLRSAPADLGRALGAALPIAAAHGAGQAATVVSLGAGAVSSTHVVKALEPLFSAALNAIINGEVLALPVYASLIPVVGGVGAAVATDLNFNPTSFTAAMASNVCFAFRAVASKGAMTASPVLASLGAPSLFGVVTVGAFLLSAPVALFLEGSSAASAVAAATKNHDPAKLATSLFLSGLFHYLNNEVMYLVLARVHPVTLAVGNTLKRVCIILAALVVFAEPMTPTAAGGTAVAIAGVLAYSVLKQKYATA